MPIIVFTHRETLPNIFARNRNLAQDEKQIASKLDTKLDTKPTQKKGLNTQD
jgi:hypothetical protein